MFKESAPKSTRWRDIDYDILSDSDSVEPLYEDAYATQIKRKSVYGLQSISTNCDPNSLYDAEGQIQKRSVSEFNHIIEDLCNQFPEIPTGSTLSVGNWSTDNLEDAPIDETLLNLLHDFCFEDNFNILACSKVLEEMRRIVPMLANCSINNYVTTLLKAKMENENIFKKPARNLGNMIDQISKDELTDLQNVQISKYHVFTNDTLMVNEEYKVPNYITYYGPKSSIVVNLTHLTSCDSSLRDAFTISFINPSITIKRGKTEMIEMCVKIRKPNLSLQELINVGINDRGRLFFIFSCKSSNAIFGVYPKYLPCSLDHDSNVIIPNALQYLKKKLIGNNGYHTNRIFRESPAKTEKDEAIRQFNNGNELTYTNPSLYASLLLYYFRSLPEPLFNHVSYEDIFSLSPAVYKDYSTQAAVIYNWMNDVEKHNQGLLIFIADIFCQVLVNHQDTQMNIESFSVLLIPNLFKQETSQEYLLAVEKLKPLVNGWLIDRMIHTFNFSYEALMDMNIINKH